MALLKNILAVFWFASQILLVVTSIFSAHAYANAVQEATVFAVTYAYPLAAFRKFAAPLLSAFGSPNRVVSSRQLAGPANQTVVRPNVDTLYTYMVVDLSQSDIVFTVPQISDGRYWVFPFYDFFGNNFAFVSITRNSPSGPYLLRRADDALVQPGITYTKPGDKSLYQGYVNFPTTYGLLIGRILVLENTTEDLNKIYQYQNGVNATVIARQSHQPRTPKAPILTPTLLASQDTDSNVHNLDTLAALGPFNQPEILSDRYNVASELGQAGLANGVYNTPPTVNFTDAVTTAYTDFPKVYNKHIKSLGNGWEIGTSAYSGDFGTNYAGRAYIAEFGYLQLVQSQAIYPSSINSTVTLPTNKSLLFTFSRRPPIKSIGFWSLTAYNAQQFLIPNSLNRYEIGDRTKDLKFENGGLVNSQPPALDGPFQVLLQPADLMPPDNWTSNWLPAPSGGGTLSFTLRWYAPSAAFTDGSYVYPVVQEIDAILA